jgi:hypothetical protein
VFSGGQGAHVCSHRPGQLRTLEQGRIPEAGVQKLMGALQQCNAASVMQCIRGRGTRDTLCVIWANSGASVTQTFNVKVVTSSLCAI